MEAALQKLEILIHHMGATPEVVTKAFIDACRDYADIHGYNLDHDSMAIHKALVPFTARFNEAEEHIIVHESPKLPLNSIVFFRDGTF